MFTSVWKAAEYKDSIQMQGKEMQSKKGCILAIARSAARTTPGGAVLSAPPWSLVHSLRTPPWSCLGMMSFRVSLRRLRLLTHHGSRHAGRLQAALDPRWLSTSWSAPRRSTTSPAGRPPGRPRTSPWRAPDGRWRPRWCTNAWKAAGRRATRPADE